MRPNLRHRFPAASPRLPESVPEQTSGTFQETDNQIQNATMGMAVDRGQSAPWYVK